MQELIFRGISQDIFLPRLLLELLLSARTYGLRRTSLEASEQVWHCWCRSHARCFLWLCKPSLSSGSRLKNDRGPVTNFKHYLEIRAESEEVRA